MKNSICIFILVFAVLANAANAVTLNYGECITINNTTYCAPDVPEITEENCTQFINPTINETYNICSQMIDRYENFSVEIVDKYLLCNQSLFNCEQENQRKQETLNRFASCAGDLVSCNSTLNDCLNTKDRCLANINKMEEDLQFYKTKSIAFVLGSFVAGMFVLWFFKLRKPHPISEVHDTFEPSE